MQRTKLPQRSLPVEIGAERGKGRPRWLRRCSAIMRTTRYMFSSTAVRDGAAPSELGSALAYAAALRIARFGTANEHSDWESAHHAFTYANALHRMLDRLESGGRVPTAEMLARAVPWRNEPLPASVPQRAASEDCRANRAIGSTICRKTVTVLCEQFLDALDRHGAIDVAPRYVARYLAKRSRPGAPPRHAGACRTARGCRLPHPSDAGGSDGSISTLGQRTGRPAYPRLLCRATWPHIRLPSAASSRPRPWPASLRVGSGSTTGTSDPSSQAPLIS